MGRKRRRSGAREPTAPALSKLGKPQLRKLRPNSWRDPDNRKEFLENLAATCNVRLSARRAGLHVDGGYRARLDDPQFREQWERALEEGHRRLYEMLCAVASEGMEKVQIQGVGADPALEEQSIKLCQWLLSRHKAASQRCQVPETGNKRPVTVEELKTDINQRLDASAERLRATGRAPPLEPPPGARFGPQLSPPFAAAPPPPPRPPFLA